MCSLSFQVQVVEARVCQSTLSSKPKHHEPAHHPVTPRQPCHSLATPTTTMALLLSPAKLVLLAVHCAVAGDVDSLTTLAARHGTVLRKDLLLRILLTYLPETVP